MGSITTTSPPSADTAAPPAPTLATSTKGSIAAEARTRRGQASRSGSIRAAREDRSVGANASAEAGVGRCLAR
jgi:hypothetical protein